jgi:hypothetical protein
MVDGGGGRRECKSKISGVTMSIYRYCGITNSLAMKHQFSVHHGAKPLALAHYISHAIYV